MNQDARVFVCRCSICSKQYHDTHQYGRICPNCKLAQNYEAEKIAKETYFKDYLTAATERDKLAEALLNRVDHATGGYLNVDLQVEATEIAERVRRGHQKEKPKEQIINRNKES